MGGRRGLRPPEFRRGPGCAAALPGHEAGGYVGGIELGQERACAAGSHGGCGERAASPAPQVSPPDGKQPGVTWQRAPGNDGTGDWG